MIGGKRLLVLLWLGAISALQVILHKASTTKNENVILGPEHKCYTLNGNFKSYQAVNGEGDKVKFYQDQSCEDEIHPFENKGNNEQSIYLGSVKISEEGFLKRMFNKARNFVKDRDISKIFGSLLSNNNNSNNDNQNGSGQGETGKNVTSSEALSILLKYAGTDNTDHNSS